MASIGGKAAVAGKNTTNTNGTTTASPLARENDKPPGSGGLSMAPDQDGSGT